MQRRSFLCADMAPAVEVSPTVGRQHLIIATYKTTMAIETGLQYVKGDLQLIAGPVGTGYSILVFDGPDSREEMFMSATQATERWFQLAA